MRQNKNERVAEQDSDLRPHLCIITPFRGRDALNNHERVGGTGLGPATSSV